MSATVIILSPFLKNSTKSAFLKTGHAFNALFLIDPGDFLLFPGNRLHRTAPEAYPATGAQVFIDFKF
jgi:hypothetical protein